MEKRRPLHRRPGRRHRLRHAAIRPRGGQWGSYRLRTSATGRSRTISPSVQKALQRRRLDHAHVSGASARHRREHLEPVRLPARTGSLPGRHRHREAEALFLQRRRFPGNEERHLPGRRPAGTTPGGISIEPPRAVDFTRRTAFRSRRAIRARPFSWIQYPLRDPSTTTPNPLLPQSRDGQHGGHNGRPDVVPDNNRYWRLGLKGSVKTPPAEQIEHEPGDVANDVRIEPLLSSYVSDVSAAASNIGCPGPYRNFAEPCDLRREKGCPERRFRARIDTPLPPRPRKSLQTLTRRTTVGPDHNDGFHGIPPSSPTISSTTARTGTGLELGFRLPARFHPLDRLTRTPTTGGSGRTSGKRRRSVHRRPAVERP
jgi:hypothetical protein